MTGQDRFKLIKHDYEIAIIPMIGIKRIKVYKNDWPLDISHRRAWCLCIGWLTYRVAFRFYTEKYWRGFE